MNRKYSYMMHHSSGYYYKMFYCCSETGPNIMVQINSSSFRVLDLDKDFKTQCSMLIFSQIGLIYNMYKD